MATVSLSPIPAPIAAMSTRRLPLSNNPNAANSPLRASNNLAALAKQKRSYATTQREEPYGQPPPMKKQALDAATTRSIRSPSKLPRAQQPASRPNATRPQPRERLVRPVTTSKPAHDADTEKEVWKKHHMAKFPKMVFYFESIPDDVRAKIIKRVTYLGAVSAASRALFSIAVTHVVTGRSIPREKPDDAENEQDQEEAQEQPQTINPSLLDRNTSEARRKLLFEFRQTPLPSQPQDDLVKRNKTVRNNDVLHKAREMGKKIWPLEKFQNMLSVLLEGEAQRGAQPARASAARGQYGNTRGHEANLLQLLHNERINGPSDRDPTAVNRELNFFKGPYIYVWDMDEKQKPVMARDYPKVVNKSDGEWPQFRSVGNGRCPFVEELDIPERGYRKAKEAREKPKPKKDEAVTILRAPENPLPKPVTGKRTLTEMEDGHNKARGTATQGFQAIGSMAKPGDLRQNAFISRAQTGRVLGGEPVASGIQASNITSAIRSQMISSTSGIHGAKAGTSKEVHGLQRKVLQKAAPGSHDISSRRVGEVSMDSASSRSTTLGRMTSKLTTMAEEGHEKKANVAPLKTKKELKPGYCENCQDKFADFDEHILSRKHRRFAEDTDNWNDLDALLSQLSRVPKYAAMDSDMD